MEKLVLSLDIVTPLFLGGADQNQPELRPASVRGALRYWFRALVGGALENEGRHLDELRGRETAVFGDTGTASAVSVRLTGTPPPMEDFSLDRYKASGIGRGAPGASTGHDYLFFSLGMKPNRERMPFAPQATGSSNVRLMLAARRDPSRALPPLQQAGAAAWLLTRLGGLGTRSRRCAGSVQVNAQSGAQLNLPDFTIAADSTEKLRDELAEGLRRLRQLFGTAAKPSLEYDVLHPALCRVWVVPHGEAGRNWKGAVERTGKAMQEFRKQRSVVDNSVFGIPVKNLTPQQSLGLSRRSSPLWLRVTRLASGEHVTVATLFKSDFAKDAHEVGGGYRLIEDFVSRELGGQEVAYG
jgi:CRISPR-associated protein Cmr1